MNYQFPEYVGTGVLNGEDLVFFYYVIGLEKLQGLPFFYDWEAIVLKFENQLDIQTCERKSIPTQFADNQIRFTVSSKYDMDNDCEAAAFFRHLRNAFSHYRIYRDGKWFFFTDENSHSQITMRGKVEVSLLIEFCCKLIDCPENKVANNDI